MTDLCAHGNLEDFMAAEGAPLSVAVKLDLMLQVARGLEALKDARVLKALPYDDLEHYMTVYTSLFRVEATNRTLAVWARF